MGCCFFFQAEDGIRDLVRSRGLGDVYKRQGQEALLHALVQRLALDQLHHHVGPQVGVFAEVHDLSLIHI